MQLPATTSLLTGTTKTPRRCESPMWRPGTPHTVALSRLVRFSKDHQEPPPCLALGERAWGNEPGLTQCVARARVVEERRWGGGGGED